MEMNYYDENAKIFFQETIDANMNESYKKFEKYLKKNAIIIDIGCGSGRDSKYFIEKGYQIIATDISKELAKLAEKTIGQKVIIENILDMKIKNKYSAAWACASLLHINREKIQIAIENIYESLKKNGILYASFKYGENEYIKNGRYFNNYTEKTIKELILKTKFSLEEIWETFDVRPGRENEKWINIIVKK